MKAETRAAVLLDKNLIPVKIISETQEPVVLTGNEVYYHLKGLYNGHGIQVGLVLTSTTGATFKKEVQGEKFFDVMAPLICESNETRADILKKAINGFFKRKEYGECNAIMCLTWINFIMAGKHIRSKITKPA